MFASGRTIYLSKGLKYIGLILDRNAGASVRYINSPIGFISAVAFDAYTSMFGKFDGIANQIKQNLL